MVSRLSISVLFIFLSVMPVRAGGTYYVGRDEGGITLGGLAVDEATGLVLGADGSVITGLYAAGRNAVGVCSQNYVSGLSIADAVFSGRRAGHHAALAGEKKDDQGDSSSVGRLRHHGLPSIQRAMEAQRQGEHHYPGPSLLKEQGTLCDL